MTGNALDADSPSREHDGETVGFCSEQCAAQWDKMSAEERSAKLTDK